jgi:sugar phosphate permease
MSMTLQQPTRARYWVVFFAVTLAILAYIDRVAISKAAPMIMKDLNISKSEMGMVFSAFAVAYALAEIPGGFMGDWLGPRKVLMRIVIWWSFFTASVGFIYNHTVLVINQALFGAGEAGCFPNLTKTFTIWLQPHEKVKAQGIMWMAARWGGAFTPLLLVYLYNFVPWRIAFVVIASLGFIWAFFFFRWFRDNPKDHPGVNEAEWKLLEANQHLAGSHTDVPWGKMVRRGSVWLLWAQYFLITYPWYLYITWLTTYLLEYRKFTEKEAALFAIFPLFFGGIGCILSGFLLPHVAKMLGSADRARRTVATIGFVGAASFVFIHTQTADARLAMVFLGMASFCNDLVMPCAWGSCMDIGGKYAGTLSGSMNMMGNFAGFFSPWIGGIILDKTGDWNIYLYTFVAAYALGALCWPFLSSRHSLDEGPEAAHT